MEFAHDRAECKDNYVDRTGIIDAQRELRSTLFVVPVLSNPSVRESLVQSVSHVWLDRMRPRQKNLNVSRAGCTFFILRRENESCLYAAAGAGACERRETETRTKLVNSALTRAKVEGAKYAR